MKKLFSITLLLFLLAACESTSGIPINPALNNNGETVCSRYYNAPHLGTTYRSSSYIEAEGGEIVSITHIETWDIDGLSDEEVDAIFEFLGPAIWFEYEIDGDVLIKSSPVGATWDLNDEAWGINSDSKEKVEALIKELVGNFEFADELEYEVDGYLLRISGIQIETWDISDKSEEEIRKLIESFGSPIAYEYEIDDKTLTRISQMDLEATAFIQGNLSLAVFVNRREEDRNYTCE